MTDEKQSPIASVPVAPELSATEGARNAEVQASTPETSQTVAPQGSGVAIPKELELINRATGRQYKTLEDAEAGLRETSSYVGTLGQKAAVVEKLAKKIAAENNVSEEAAIRYVQELAEAEAHNAVVQASEVSQVARESTEKSSRTPQDFQTEIMKGELQELKLLRKFPEAESHVDLIRRVSQADGRDYADIYEKDIKPLVLAGRDSAYQSQATKEGASVVSTSREAPPPDEYAKTFKAFQSGKASVADMLRAKGLRIAPRE